MKILMCGNHSRNNGGMTTIIRQINAFNWTDKGIELRFIPTYYPGNFFKKFFYFGQAFLKIVLCLITWQPNSIHTHLSSGASILRNRIICYFAHLFNVKTIVHMHGSQFRDYYMWQDERSKKGIINFLKDADLLIVLGNKWREFILDICPKSNVFVLNNSVEIPKKITRNRKEIFCILYSGVLIDRKGIIYLLEALKKMIENGENKVFLKIAGSGEKQEELQNYCINNDINNYVDFLGWVDTKKMNNLYQWADVLVLPSFNEGLPMAIIEAMANALPIVATDVGSVAEAVIDNYNGFLCTKGSAESLYEKIKRLYESEDTLFCFSENSYRLAKDKFALSVFYEKLAKIYAGEMFVNNEKNNSL